MGVHFKENEEKITTTMIITGAVVISLLLIFLITFLIQASKNNTGSEIIEEKVGQKTDTDDDFETVSIDMSKKVEDSKKEINETSNIESTAENITNTSTEQNNNDIKNEINKNSNTNVNLNKKDDIKSNITANTGTENITETKETVAIQEKQENEKKVEFIAPVNGEIIREFAPDSLVYSKTLEEWVTHTGIDIKADKTTVVACSAKGTVTAIKNDPRYGITVIVNHENGYQTVYSNLLTAEYVVEGENLEEGQTIGTIGNTASFEVADEYHLHFELLKDGEYVNPCNYINLN